ncbi:MAG: murein biosynthesis integral membrane protein MurJ [candidate division Zixibacteria bacterium]|nr:murein biosynthesis integral membrane protein MurJ [candidate division Zixibacteria bacterium]
MSKLTTKSFARSVGLVSIATFVSRITGLIREQVIAYYFGASTATDAFFTAFRIPNLLRDMFAEGALSSAFVPVFKEKLVKSTEPEAFRLVNVVMTFLILVVGLVTLLGILASPAIIFLTAHGFTSDPMKYELTVSLTRVMFPFLLLVSVGALVMGILNSFGRFGVPAFSSAMFNIGSIATLIILYAFMDTPIYALAIGVLVGGFAQLVIQLPQLHKIGFRPRFRLEFFNEDLRKILRLFTPIVIGLSAGRINILVSTLLASFLIEGSISYLNYSFRLMHFPLGVFAVALGTVALPRLTELVVNGKITELADSFEKTINVNMLLIIPSTVFLAIMGRDLVTLIYQWGAFTETAVDGTALTLLHYSYGLIGFAAVRVTVPIFYALGDSKLPMIVSVISVGVNLALYYPLIRILDFAGLAAATSLAALLNFGLLLYLLPRKGVPVPVERLMVEWLKILLASLLAFYIANLIPVDQFVHSSVLVERMANLFIPMFVALLLFVGLGAALKIHSLNSLAQRIIKLKR